MEVERRPNQSCYCRVTQKLWEITSNLYLFEALADSVSWTQPKLIWLITRSSSLLSSQRDQQVDMSERSPSLELTRKDYTHCHPVCSYPKFSGEFHWIALPPLLCILRHHAAVPYSMPSLQICSAVKISHGLIFDVSYGGLSCVNWNGDATFICTWRIKRNVDILAKVQVLETICGKYYHNNMKATVVQMIIVILV